MATRRMSVVPDATESNLPSPTALAISVLLHLLVAALVLGVMTGTTLPQGIERETPADEPPEDETEVLGIDESEAETLTWIGYDEYEEHLARLSEIEQAAMAVGSPDGGGGGGAAPAAAAASMPTPPPLPGAARPSSSAPAPTAPAIPTENPEVVEAPEVETTPQEAPTDRPTEADPKTPTDATTSETSPTEKPSTAPEDETTPRETEDEQPEPTEEPTSDPETEPETPTEEPTDAPEETEPKPAPEPTPTPAPEPTPEPTPEPSPSPAPTPEPSDSPGEGDGEGPANPSPEPGNDADRDAEATSVVDTPQSNWRHGRPLATQGLTLQPRRLHIPLLTWNKIRPTRTPVAEFEFGRNGVPKRARLAVTSGDELLDGYINDALYRWRARGSRLQELKGDDTALVRLKLLFK